MQSVEYTPDRLKFLGDWGLDEKTNEARLAQLKQKQLKQIGIGCDTGRRSLGFDCPHDSKYRIETYSTAYCDCCNRGLKTLDVFNVYTTSGIRYCVEAEKINPALEAAAKEIDTERANHTPTEKQKISPGLQSELDDDNGVDGRI